MSNMNEEKSHRKNGKLVKQDWVGVGVIEFSMDTEMEVIEDPSYIMSG